MKKLILITALSLFSTISFANTSSNEKANIFLQNCMHVGPGVSFGFQSCVNNNFNAIARITRGFNQHCTNFGSEVDFNFVNCVNLNFRDVERRLGNRVWLQMCNSFDRKNLDFNFVNCVNTNYRAIEREIRQNR